MFADMQFVEPYNPGWKNAFEQLNNFLLESLQGFSGQITIEHVGSTSVPGMVSKPILDIDLILADQKHLPGMITVLQSLGYDYRGDQGIPGRFAFRQRSAEVPLAMPAQTWHKHHLYICYDDSPALKNHLVFRELLRQDKLLAAAYAALKNSLSVDPGMTREKYTILKTEFIISALDGAGFNAQELDEIRKLNS
ncbi:MAG: GrpB family protein [Chitinophagaceae bacterium]|nr:MAG: GrpB family protein [Chitinophagaceae bacterium]